MEITAVNRRHPAQRVIDRFTIIHHLKPDFSIITICQTEWAVHHPCILVIIIISARGHVAGTGTPAGIRPACRGWAAGYRRPGILVIVGIRIHNIPRAGPTAFKILCENRLPLANGVNTDIALLDRDRHTGQINRPGDRLKH